MKALKPPVWSCWRRSRSRWSIRCSTHLDMAVEDRGIGRDPEPVCSSMHLEPLYGRPFIGTDSGTQLLVENFGTPARYRLHPGAAEQTQPFVDSQPRFADHVGELDGGKGFDGRFGQNRLHAADHLDIIVRGRARDARPPRYALRSRPAPHGRGRWPRPPPGSSPTPRDPPSDGGRSRNGS